MKSFKRTNLISFWEEDGDLEQMRTFFKAIQSDSENNKQIKQSIKQKALEKMAAEQREEVSAPIKKSLVVRLRTRWSTVNLISHWKLGFTVIGLTLLFIVGQTTLNGSWHVFPQMGSAVPQKQMSQVAAGSSAPSPSAEDRVSKNTISSENTAPLSAKISAAAPQTPVQNDAGPTNTSVPRKITQDVTLTLEVANISNTFSQISQKVQQMGGYIAESQQNNSENQSSARMTVKIPADKLDALNDSLISWGKILDQHTIANDITNQYYDSQNRLQTLQAEEKRYLEILNQAKTVDDVLKVENALSDIRQQIEQLEGQLKLWNNQVDYSTVNLQLVVNSGPNLAIKNPWQPVSWQNTWEAAQNAFLKTISSAWNFLNYLVVGLGYVFPYLILGLVGWICYLRKIKR
ncbi:DUF4349 domain-containing protein [Desulfosporosinus sp. SB140]|uniref:DUF4349 domain-containing protein n=1 Tax=Desulfosporosinus paludis TaxID=3115649 RepID=UPI003890B114